MYRCDPNEAAGFYPWTTCNLQQNTVFYTCRRPFGSGGQSRSSAPASSRRRGGAGGRAPLVRGEGGEWRARVRSGGGPSAGAAGLEFPSKGIRREFWKYYASCRAHPATITLGLRRQLQPGCNERILLGVCLLSLGLELRRLIAQLLRCPFGTTTTGSSLVHC